MNVVTSRDVISNVIMYIEIHMKLKRVEPCRKLDFEHPAERFVYPK